MLPDANEHTGAARTRPTRETHPFRCPQCGASATVSVQSIVEARDGAARRRLVEGALNVAKCPACGLASRIATPVLYHDGPHDIAYVLVPQALNLAHVDQEAAVGRLTNRVLNELPPAERRMYLLQPTLFLGEAAFLNAVQSAPPSPPPPNSNAGASARSTNGAVETPAGSRPTESIAADSTRGAADDTAVEVDFDDVVNALREAHAEGVLEDAVAELRMLLDYPFFLELTARIDKHSADGRPEMGDELLAFRGELVETIDRVDSATRAALDEAVATLRGILTSDDPELALRDLPFEALNDAFFLVLAANQQAAADAGDAAAAERLLDLNEVAVEAVEEKLPPVRRLVAKLARTNDEGIQSALLDDDPLLWGEELQSALYGTAAVARSQGAPGVADNLSAAIARLATRMQGQRVEA